MLPLPTGLLSMEATANFKPGVYTRLCKLTDPIGQYIDET
jgi:hypothetical protein